ncbi:MAG: SDR family NAD(P)-dependent oxidoreductase, partial [Kineosporiaceae bacterium]|nr:SDR family NAD(P)-dependent oxidoreductase [Aeromicrobium sp.]
MIVDQKVAIVTGGGGGIGAALAEALVVKGARVVVADISADKVADVAA